MPVKSSRNIPGFDVTLLPEDTGIWRYMDIGRFLAMLSSREIYFARARELPDPTEGRVHEQFWSDGVPPHSEAPGLFIRLFYEYVTSRAMVSCWHENEIESIAMWRLYTTGAEGIAIKSTVGLLQKSLAESAHHIELQRVRYINPKPGESPGSLFSPTFSKGLSFQHEREVRAAIFADIKSVQQVLELAKSSWPLAEEVVKPFREGCLEAGEAIPVKLTTLIERIVVAPTFPHWAIPAIQRIVNENELTVKIESSALTQPPRGVLGWASESLLKSDRV